ncbi:hypothetical protein CVV67_05180 [Arthrobacter stackebrandtii]|nr:hypothetical protein CVV67_05180 [Arthrobacter stackebrandtii]
MPSQEQRDALQAYIKAEQATVPNLMATTLAGIYSEMTIDGRFEPVNETRNRPSDGTPAVVWHAEIAFSYRYLPELTSRGHPNRSRHQEHGLKGCAKLRSSQA